MRSKHGATVADIASLLANARRPTASPAGVCNLCRRQTSSLQRHIGRHLEQLALFAIPRIDFNKDDEEDDDDDDRSAASHDAVGTNPQAATARSSSGRSSGMNATDAAHEVSNEVTGLEGDDDSAGVDSAAVPDTVQMTWDQIPTRYHSGHSTTDEDEEFVARLRTDVGTLTLEDDVWKGALRTAAATGNAKIVQLILERAIKIRTGTNIFGEVSEIARKNGYKEVVGLISEYLEGEHQDCTSTDRKPADTDHSQPESDISEHGHVSSKVEEENEQQANRDNATAGNRGLSHGDYSVGWLCAINDGFLAATLMFDETHEDLETSAADANVYKYGRIGECNVVIATPSLDGYGRSSMEEHVADMMHSFAGLRFILTIGIGGGLPSDASDVRLGDVVIGGLSYYEVDRNGAVEEVQAKARSGPLPQLLKNALSRLESEHTLVRERIQDVLQEVGRTHPEWRDAFTRPDDSADLLFKREYTHVRKREDCRYCDPNEVVVRSFRASHHLTVHHGVIASGATVVRDPHIRDRIREQLKAICVESYAGGSPVEVQHLAIRGICDYADSHMNRKWQQYAAAASAACAKALLEYISKWELSRPAEPLDSQVSQDQPPTPPAGPSMSQVDQSGQIEPPENTDNKGISKSVRVSLNDPCHVVLPMALKRYNILDDWRNYSLWIVHGNEERLLGLQDKPLVIYKQMDEEGKKPMFMLRKHVVVTETESKAESEGDK
ncbi:Protein STE50 [Sphaceloma murrayae]|uniref:Protein STE50 n=1 Tax=Sphaceloma murrayae TaxID=2082308 RepID=A0A2K1QXI2_9PEZI|nr:Protein STE50 [Sphaceloma murrayae]